ncbi:MAG: VPLPA-CTERM sorting domain-containing protein [Gammaproteobacteria bacterium]|nr:VPLPA-CTERM sorting domain-containing protein [Gammaproteobacteria bacterium]
MATALVATCSTPAFAAVVYDAIGPGNAYVQYQIGWQVNASFAPTVEFAASGNYEVTQIDVLLVYDSGTNGATISLLTATTGGAPGDVLGSWGVSALPASGLGPLTTVYSISQVNLLAGQSYFLRIAPADATTNGAWLFGANETTIYNGDALAYSSNNAPAFRILGSSPVPLPAAAWLLGSAIGGLGFLRRCSQPGSAVRTGSRRGAVFLHGRRRNWATLRADELGDRNMFTVANGR